MRKKVTTSGNTLGKRSHTMVEHYLYMAVWSEDDEAYVARVAELPSLAAHGEFGGGRVEFTSKGS